MLRTTIVKLGATLSAIAVAIAAPAAASGSATGGASFHDASAPSVFADGSTLSAAPGLMLGGGLHVHGRLMGSRPGDALELQGLDRRAGWVTSGIATVAADGSFDGTWTSNRAGHTSVRVIAAGAHSGAVAATAGGPVRAVTVYRPAVATWYGPGLYGRRTACGRTLTHHLLGIAHRTLPCGTLVELYNGGRTVTVPVVDRGPFHTGAAIDLTAATAHLLGVNQTTTIGTVRASSAEARTASSAAAGDR